MGFHSFDANKVCDTFHSFKNHDFNSLNYMHMEARKTWYGVPRDAALAFDNVVAVRGYGCEIYPICE